MPELARFPGIVIGMFFREHGVPHFHAIYGEYVGVFDLAALKMIEGNLPARAKRLVLAWARRYRKELTEMWKRQEYVQLPGLE